MRLQLFNGGLNTRLASHLIAVNESVLNKTIDDSKGDIRPLMSKATNGSTSGEYRYYFSALSTWVNSSTNRDYVEYQEKLYYTEVGAVPKVYNGTTEYLLGIVPPQLPASVFATSAGVLTGTYQYAYTYYSSSTGVESGPSLLSAEISVTATIISVSGMQLPTDPQVDRIRLYRIGGSLVDFSLVIELAITVSSYADNIADTAIQGTLLSTIGYSQAPTGLHSIIEAYGILFGLLGDKIYFTQIGLPWAWSELNFIDLPVTCTGLAVVSNGVLVYTAIATYLLTGSTPSAFQLWPFDKSQGCVSHKSIAYNGNQVMWLSNSGICSSDGGQVQVLTELKLGKVVIYPKQAVVYDKVYYLIDNANLIWVIDLRYGGSIKQYSTLDVTYLCTGNDTLLGYSNGSYYELFKGEAKHIWQYLSPVFLNGAYTERKQYKLLYMRSSGDVTLTVYIDAKLVLTQSFLTTDTHEVKLPEEYKDGYSIQIGLTGTGEVYELDWIPKGRAR